jgi:hypothetical protein
VIRQRGQLAKRRSRWIADPHALLARRGELGRHRRVHRLPPAAGRLRARALQLRRDRARARSGPGTAPNDRLAAHRRHRRRRAPHAPRHRSPAHRPHPRRWRHEPPRRIDLTHPVGGALPPMAISAPTPPPHVATAVAPMRTPGAPR